MEGRNFKRTLAIGDVHGCYYTLCKVLEEVHYDKNHDRLIMLGDYVDRGNNSKLVIDYLMELQNEVGEDAVICLKGNHEELFVQYCHGYSEWLFDKNTLSQLKGKIYTYTQWMKKLPLYFETEKFVFVHGGVPLQPIEQNTNHELIWTYRWDYTYEGVKPLICGHSPTDSIYIYNNVIGIDTGCCFGKSLSVLIIDEREQIHYTTINADKRDLYKGVTEKTEKIEKEKIK